MYLGERLIRKNLCGIWTHFVDCNFPYYKLGMKKTILLLCSARYQIIWQFHPSEEEPEKSIN